MSPEKQLIDANDIYSLFDKNGFARLHVADIDTIPRVDAVEVVRCKDCKHYKTRNQSKYWDNKALACRRSANVKVRPDDFCSYGERRTDGKG